MTAYNREKYISEAIESVIASTYQNWELIIVDDKSKDKTVEIAKNYADKDSRIKLYINEINLGDYPNRNKAASYATGKYLKYIDADDMIYPYGLEQMVFYMEQFPEAGYGLFTMKQDKNKAYPYQLSPQEAYIKHYFKFPIFNRAPLSSIIQREVFNLVGGFTGKQNVGDFEFWHILSRKYPVVLMPHSHGHIWWREHDDQQHNIHKSNPFFLKYLLLANDMLEHKDCPLDENQKRIALKNNYKAISRKIIIGTLKHSIKKGLQAKKASKLSFLDIFRYAI